MPFERTTTIASPSVPGRSAASIGLLEAIWRYRIAVGALVVGFAVVIAGVSALRAPTYEATARLVLVDPQTNNVFSEGQLTATDIARSTAKQAEYIESSRVLQLASEGLGGDATVTELRETTTATPLPEIDTIEVVARGPSAASAALRANTVTTAFREVVRAQGRERTNRAQEALASTREELQGTIDDAGAQLQVDPTDQAASAELEAAVQQLAAVQTRASETAVNAALADDGLEFVEPAIEPESAVSPRPLRNGLAAALFAFLLSGPLSWFWADRNRLLIHARDPEAVLGAPLLGEVPKVRMEERTALQSPRSMPLAAYDVVAVNVRHLEDSRVLLVTSPRPGDGKTVTAMNLAAALVSEHRRVVLVDGDARKRGLTQSLGVDPSHPGLTDLARGNESLDDCSMEVKFADGKLRFVPSGEASSDLGPLFRSTGMRDTIRRLSATGDTVILDSPPVLAGSDTASLAETATSVLVVISRRTPTAMVEQTRQSLGMVGAPVAGYLFTQSKGRRMDYYGVQAPHVQHDDAEPDAPSASAHAARASRAGAASPRPDRRSRTDDGRPMERTPGDRDE